jgi:hypothetical protein
LNRGYPRGNGVSAVSNNIFTNNIFINRKGKQSYIDLFNFSGKIMKYFYSKSINKSTNLDNKREIECSYKQLFDINIYKTAYLILQSKSTLEVNKESLDGISLT